MINTRNLRTPQARVIASLHKEIAELRAEVAQCVHRQQPKDRADKPVKIAAINGVPTQMWQATCKAFIEQFPNFAAEDGEPNYRKIGEELGSLRFKHITTQNIRSAFAELAKVASGQGEEVF